MSSEKNSNDVLDKKKRTLYIGLAKYRDLTQCLVHKCKWKGEGKMQNRWLRRILFSALFLSGILTASEVISINKAMANPVTLELLNPTGAIEISNLFAPRLANLSGKTICELSDGLWEDYRTFPLIRQLLQKRFPDVKIIPYIDLPVGTPNIDVDGIGDIVKKKGCQAVIVGNSA